MLQERYTRDYLCAPLAALAVDTTIQVSWVENPETKCFEAQIDKDKISEATKTALADLKAELFKPKTIKDCVDIYQLLIAAYYAYDSHFDRLQDWHRRDAFSILVIGFIQSLVNPSLGKGYCEDLYSVVYERKKISPQAESLVFIDGRSFYRSSRDSSYGLGSNFLCSIYGSVSGREVIAMLGRGRGGLLENYVKQMYQSVTTLRSECTRGADVRQKPAYSRDGV